MKMYVNSENGIANSFVCSMLTQVILIRITVGYLEVKGVRQPPVPNLLFSNWNSNIIII